MWVSARFSIHISCDLVEVFYSLFNMAITDLTYKVHRNVPRPASVDYFGPLS